MHRTLAVLAASLVLVSVAGAQSPVYEPIPGSIPVPNRVHNVKDWGPLDYDDTPGAEPGGIVFGRVNGQRFVRIGGGLLPMRVRVTEPGPDGPVTTRLIYPSSLQSPYVPLALQHQLPPSARPNIIAPAETGLVPACVRVRIPNPAGLLYLDEQLTKTEGAVRELQSPPLERGKPHVFRLRAAFMAGDNLLIEDREVTVRAGESAEVSFDGKRALAVYLPMTDKATATAKSR